MKLSARGFKIAVMAVVLGVGAGVMSAYVAAQPTEQVIKVSAKKFAFTPNTITLKKGVPVVLEFTTEGVLMGFNAPDLGARADIVPGQATRIRIVPGKIGRFTFFCDIFCGAGHEDMTGMITVVEPA
ncbi:MAG TPA: cupredoxin domain-containing protein [Acidiferrobacterales bacterium]|nr:cupredoxin domain-containing protein [Acidiferrobacterales bacterium]